MRRKRRNISPASLNRYLLYSVTGLLVLAALTVNCSFGDGFCAAKPLTGAFLGYDRTSGQPVAAGIIFPEAQSVDAAGGREETLSDFLLWADAFEAPVSRPAHTTPANISLDLREANLLDVLSLLAHKLDANIIFLGTPTKITIKTENLSPLTTLQLILQKEGLDYLTVGRNYIVAGRERLYGDFNNRTLLTRFGLHYVSAEAMESYIRELGLPVQSLTVDANRRALWMQGTPMALGKARELVNSLDIKENAAFAEGGGRKIRMPVAIATGNRAEEELEALVDLLSILLDGFRDGRTDMGWVTWDHPDPVPRIYMDWDSPIIKPYDIKMKITRDFAGDYTNQLRYLIAEGNPDNITLVNRMIAAIRETPTMPFTFQRPEEPDQPDLLEDTEGGLLIPAGGVETAWPQYNPGYSVVLTGVPPAGGRLSGGGSYPQGSGVTVTAIAADGYRFVRWIEAGAELSTASTYTFTVYSDRRLEAVFRRDGATAESSAGEAENPPSDQ